MSSRLFYFARISVPAVVPPFGSQAWCLFDRWRRLFNSRVGTECFGPYSSGVSSIDSSLLKLGRGDPFVTKWRPRHPVELEIEDRLSVKEAKVIRAIIWLYSLMATIIFTLLGLALLISSVFGHAFVMVFRLGTSLLSW